MKTLYLYRHAKSSWKDMHLPDFDRPLNKRGKRDLPVMGERLARQNISFDLILSSPSLRTTQTISQLVQYIDYAFKEIVWDDRLYLSGAYEVEEMIGALDDNYRSVAIVFHNPAITELGNRLQNEVQIMNVPTCGMVSVALDTDRWKHVFDNPGKLNFFLTPKTDKKYTAD